MNAQQIHDRIDEINELLKGINPDTDESVNLLAEREDLCIKLDLLWESFCDDN